MTLNSRSKEIIVYLCQQSDFVTYKQIGQVIDVSARTVIREMPLVDGWLKPHGISVIKKSRHGVRLDANAETRKTLLQMLVHQSVEKIYTQKERHDLILLELLQTEEPLKQYYFSSMLQVSEATVSHDLDKIEERVKDYSLRLSRKPGYGIQLIGREKDRRKLMVNVFYDYLSKEQLVALTRESIDQDLLITRMVSQTSQRLLDLVSRENLILIERIVRDIARDHQVQLAESAKIGLIVHLALAVERVKKDETITMQEDVFEELNRSEEFQVADLMLHRISEACGVDMPREEAGFITMHMKGSKMKAFAGQSFDAELTNYQLVRLVGKVIRLAEQETGKSLDRDGQLRNGLVVHLKPALIRMRLQMEIRNPLLEKIKNDYGQYFDLAGKCQKPIEDFVGHPLPAEETGYLAMHLGAAVEKEALLKRRKARIVVTCTTGIGSSKMLAMRLEREIDDIEILEILPTMEIDEERLLGQSTDLLVSTVELKTKIPLVVVSPILSVKEQEQVRDALAVLDLEPASSHQENPLMRRVENGVWTPAQLMAWTEDIQSVAETVQDLVKEFWLQKIKAASVESIVDAYVLDKLPAAIRDLAKQRILEREVVGSTILENEEIILLHNKVESLQHLYVGVALLTDKVLYKDKWIAAAVILLGPERMSQVQNESISAMSRGLIDSEKLIEAIRRQDQEEIKRAVGDLYYHHVFDRVTRLGGEGRKQ